MQRIQSCRSEPRVTQFYSANLQNGTVVELKGVKKFAEHPAPDLRKAKRLAVRIIV